MQPIAVLSAVFALLLSYLEWMAPASYPTAQQGQVARVIVRDASTADRQQVAVATVKSSPQPIAEKILKPLNLALPASVEAVQLSQPNAQQTSILSGLFEERSANERVTYNAELVFDRETGEDITGGKVNIKIPLS